MNRVDQVYEDDLSIRLQLVANNDLLNLDTLGPGDRAERAVRRCGLLHAVAGHRLLEHDARNRFVIGQIIGASNYDIGHLALGAAGRRRREPRRRRPLEQGRGCTGIPTPVG